MCPPQKQKQTQPIFQTAIFQNKFTLSHIKLKIYIWKTKFTTHKQYFYGRLFSSNTTNAYIDQSIPQVFHSVWKEISHKLSKAAAAKSFFPSVYVNGTTCFGECFLFHVITGRHYFLYKFIVTQSFCATTMLLRSLKQVFWKKSACYLRYLHNNITMLLISKVQNKASTLRYFNFEPSFKLQWCRARELFGSQIPVATGGFELPIFCIRSSYLTQ